MGCGDALRSALGGVIAVRKGEGGAEAIFGVNSLALLSCLGCTRCALSRKRRGVSRVAIDCMMKQSAPVAASAGVSLPFRRLFWFRV